MMGLIALKKSDKTESKSAIDMTEKPSEGKSSKTKAPNKDTAKKERKFIPGWRLPQRPPTRQSLAILSGCYLPSSENHREGSVVLSHGVYRAKLNHRCSDPEPNVPYLLRAWLRQSQECDRASDAEHYRGSETEFYRQLSFEIISYDSTIPPDHFDHAIIAGYLSAVRDRSFTISIRPTAPKIKAFSISICGKSRYDRGSVVRVGCLLSEKGLLAIASQDPRKIEPAKEKKTSHHSENATREDIKLTTAKMDVTLKINEIPAGVETLEKGLRRFDLDCDGCVVRVTIKPKMWKKMVEAQENYPMWVAAISGKMGESTEKGFILDQPNIQVFERKPKPPKEGE